MQHTKFAAAAAAAAVAEDESGARARCTRWLLVMLISLKGTSEPQALSAFSADQRSVQILWHVTALNAK